jgi:hypothetical protein
VTSIAVCQTQTAGAIGSCINNVLAPSLRDSVTNLWIPFSPRYHPIDEDLSMGTPEKRGANQLCASGAVVRTFLLQYSIKPNIILFLFRHE